MIQTIRRLALACIAVAALAVTATSQAAGKIEDPFNLYVFAVVKETVPSDLLSQIDAAIAQESDEMAGKQDGAVSRDFGPRLWDLSVGQKTIKMVSEAVSFEVSHPGNGNTWEAVQAVPSARFAGRTYFWGEIPRRLAREETSRFQARNFRSPNCTPYHPKSKPLTSSLNQKPDAPSELAQMAADLTKTGFRMWVMMSCPSLR